RCPLGARESVQAFAPSGQDNGVRASRTPRDRSPADWPPLLVEPSSVVADASENGGATRCALPTANTRRHGGRFIRNPTRVPPPFYPCRGGEPAAHRAAAVLLHPLVPDPRAGPNLD